MLRRPVLVCGDDFYSNKPLKQVGMMIVRSQRNFGNSNLNPSPNLGLGVLQLLLWLGVNPVKNKYDWILYIGALRHFNSNWELFHSFWSAFMDDSIIVGVLGKWKVLLKFSFRETFIIEWYSICTFVA